MSFIRYLHLSYAIIDHLLFDIFIHYTFIMYLQVYTLQFPHLLHYIAHIFMASNRITILSPPPLLFTRPTGRQPKRSLQRIRPALLRSLSFEQSRTQQAAHMRCTSIAYEEDL